MERVPSTGTDNMMQDFDVVDVEHDFTRRWFAPNDDEHRALLRLSKALGDSQHKRGGTGQHLHSTSRRDRAGAGGVANSSAAEQQGNGNGNSHQSVDDGGFEDVGPAATVEGGGDVVPLAADPLSSNHLGALDDSLQQQQQQPGEVLSRGDSTQTTNSNPSDEDAGEEEDEEEDPDVETPFMICPLTSEVMVDPVITSDGMTYERVAIENWIKTSKKSKNKKKLQEQGDFPEGCVAMSPLTNQPITGDLRPNLPLKDAITKWCDIKRQYKKKVQELTDAEWEVKFEKMQEESDRRMGEVRQELARQEEKAHLRSQLEGEKEQRKDELEALLKKELAKDYVRHWQRDSTATRCIHCQTKFGNFRRKHHCRNCGYIFCHACCSSLAQIEGVTNKVAKVRAQALTNGSKGKGAGVGSASSTSNTSASTSTTSSGVSADLADATPPPLERVCVRCALMFSNTPAGDGPAIVIVPPSFKNYFLMNHTQHWTASMGDAVESWSEYVKANAPVAGQWAKDTTVTMADQLMRAWSVATSKVTGK